jgi:hypothetical protein
METGTKIMVTDEATKKVNRAIYFFWGAFVLYSLSYTISTSDSVNYIYCQVLQILSLAVLIPSAVILMRWQFETTYLKVLYTMYVLWILTVISRGFQFNYQFVKQMLFDSGFGLFLYFVPLVLLLPRDLAYYKNIFNVIFILSIAYILYDVLFLRELLYMGRNIRSQSIIEYFSLNLSLQAGFLLLTYMYHTRKRVLIALAAVALTFIFSAIRARRGLMFMSSAIMILSYFMYYYAHKVKLVVFVISIIVITALYVGGSRIYNKNSSGLFGYLTDRVDEQTRTGVETYFYSDMTTTDWIIGKGIVGEYYCPGIENGEVTAYRGVIETGYLQIILKGGIISLGLFLLIAIPAMFKGLFRSKNFLSKAAGIWIFLFLIELYPATPVAFSMNYIMVWISIGICYSKTIRDTTEEAIAEILSS